MRKVSIFYQDREETLYVHDNEYIGKIVESSKTYYEIEFLEYIARNYHNQNVVLDIGANIGNHSVFFARHLDCTKVIAFEPVDVNLKVLRKNLEEFGERAEIVETALSNTSGERPLYNSCVGNFGGFSLEKYGHSFVVQDSIQIATLDSLNLQGVTMMKLDVESHENEVLEGAKNTIEENKPIIFVENCHYSHPWQHTNPEPHAKILQSYGYRKAEANIARMNMDLWVPR